MSITEEMTPAYARHVGERLRNIRRQQGLSLQAVEEQSDREFKASVLGAYERGERIISVLRLQRLARLYAVPVDQLLPKLSSDPEFGLESRAPAAPGGGPITIDLSRLERLDAPEREVLRRYIGMIQIQRGDFNGRLITIRSEDVRALAGFRAGRTCDAQPHRRARHPDLIAPRRVRSGNWTEGADQVPGFCRVPTVPQITTNRGCDLTERAYLIASHANFYDLV